MDLHEFPEAADLDNNCLSVPKSLASYLPLPTLPMKIIFVKLTLSSVNKEKEIIV